jgi:hypothetical protein
LQMFVCYLVHVSETVVASVLVFHENLTLLKVQNKAATSLIRMVFSYM